jgi:hypothetical protein
MYSGCCVCDELLVALTALLRSERRQQPGQQVGLAAEAAAAAGMRSSAHR